MVHQKKRYRLYLDESGDHAYAQLHVVHSRYLTLLGVWFEQPDADTSFATELDTLKQQTFGKPGVILHARDMIHKSGPFGVFCDDQVRNQFDDGLIDIITAANFKMVCVTIDKKHHKEQYISPDDPYHYCLKAMLDRYCGWLRYKNAVGDVMAESRNKHYNQLLDTEYRQIYDRGTYVQSSHSDVLTSTSLKFSTKVDDVAGIQLADILANPVRQCVLANRQLTSAPGPFAQRLWGAVQGKFNRHEWSGRIAGYGISWLGPP